MISLNVAAFVGLSFLATFSAALPHRGEPGRPHGPSRGPGGPSRGLSSSATLFDPTFPGPTGVFPTGFPTGFPSPGTATNGLPVVPLPTFAIEEDLLHEKRFEGPRGHGPSKPWHPYKPSPNKPSRPVGSSQPPPLATAGPIPSGTQLPPIVGPTGGPGGPPPPGPTRF